MDLIMHRAALYSDSIEFFPQVSDLPENLTVEQNCSEYGGVGSKRYRQTLADIDARLDRCPALSMAAP